MMISQQKHWELGHIQKKCVKKHLGIPFDTCYSSYLNNICFCSLFSLVDEISLEKSVTFDLDSVL